MWFYLLLLLLKRNRYIYLLNFYNLDPIFSCFWFEFLFFFRCFFFVLNGFVNKKNCPAVGLCCPFFLSRLLCFQQTFSDFFFFFLDLVFFFRVSLADQRLTMLSDNLYGQSASIKLIFQFISIKKCSCFSKVSSSFKTILFFKKWCLNNFVQLNLNLDFSLKTTLENSNLKF